jgi:uncharacterized protein (TIGR03382 family)
MRFVLAVAALLAMPLAAHATYSIVAVDRSTNQIGGTSASCVGNTDLHAIYGSVPGMGVVHAQALLGSPGRDRAVELLGMGVPPDMIIAMITDPGFDSNFARRQYGVVDLEGRAAGFTGTRTLAFADDLQGEAGAFVYSIQGNILTSRLVLEQSEEGFLEEGCDLADRLMRALERGAENGQGDSRCTPGGIPSDHAFIQVDRAGEPAGDYLLLQVRNTEPADPIPLLRAEFDTWRAENPCTAPAMDAGGTDAGDRDSGAIDASARDAGSVDASTAREDDGGCSCSTADAGGPLACALVLVAWLRRR